MPNAQLISRFRKFLFKYLEAVNCSGGYRLYRESLWALTLLEWKVQLASVVQLMRFSLLFFNWAKNLFDTNWYRVYIDRTFKLNTSWYRVQLAHLLWFVSVWSNTLFEWIASFECVCVTEHRNRHRTSHQTKHRNKHLAKDETASSLGTIFTIWTTFSEDNPLLKSL